MYSSNENIAIVTEYGTLLGISPGEVEIMAVNKQNYGIFYIKKFKIKEDSTNTIRTIRINDAVQFNDMPYLLKLNAQNCPFPKFAYYRWSISVISEENSSFNYHINQWGYVSVSKPCEICVIGRYLYNDNYKVLYFLVVY